MDKGSEQEPHHLAFAEPDPEPNQNDAAPQHW
jgi:hypothetical protein